ncbi:ciliary microtubule inner protein 5 isoform X1 [Heliangelus exortis]|uniref:ciliary microtubule inner protein 5 isoform X1 n=1 Tax=Heliangelus exortis TaxID=472823 RepID=UPI003A8E8402
MDKSGMSSRFRNYNTMVRSWQRATTPRGKATLAPPVSLSSTQPRKPVVAQPAPQAWENKQAALQKDQVQQDKIWRESVEAEQRRKKIWCQNWSFLSDYDQLGRKKEQKPLPKYVPVFSSKIPNSTNQTIGSHLNTELGRALINMDYFFTTGAKKRKLEVELQPS